MRVRYLHSDIDTLERVRLLHDLRLGKFDTIIGINLLREGLDLPEVSLVAILDADKEGFLRSETSLIQTAGRAARNVDGKVILYADRRTGSIRRMMKETGRRRSLQEEYNRREGLTPTGIQKAVGNAFSSIYEADYAPDPLAGDILAEYGTMEEMEQGIEELEKSMRSAAAALEFERAAVLRDRIDELRKLELSLGLSGAPLAEDRPPVKGNLRGRKKGR
jgi:excinuclease ABC subunit B